MWVPVTQQIRVNKICWIQIAIECIWNGNAVISGTNAAAMYTYSSFITFCITLYPPSHQIIVNTTCWKVTQMSSVFNVWK